MLRTWRGTASLQGARLSLYKQNPVGTYMPAACAVLTLGSPGRWPPASCLGTTDQLLSRHSGAEGHSSTRLGLSQASGPGQSPRQEEEAVLTPWSTPHTPALQASSWDSHYRKDSKLSS